MVSATARRALRSTTFFTTLFLILSTTQMVVRAQTVTLNMPNEGTHSQSLPANTSAETVAKMMTNLFSTIDQNLGTANLAQGAGDTLDPFSLQGLNLTAIPNLSKLLGNLTTAPINGTFRSNQQALLGALSQAQQSGDLKSLESAAGVLVGFTALPFTVGSGRNIETFVSSIEQLRALRDTVQTYLGAGALNQVTGYLNTAEKLVLEFVAAFPLAELSFFIANLALASAITGIIGGIFFIVGASLLLAATSSSLPPPPPGTRNATAGLAHTLVMQRWYQAMRAQSMKVAEPALSIAFSTATLAPMRMVSQLLGSARNATCVFSSDTSCANAA